MTEGCGAFRAVIRQFQVHPEFSASNVSKIRAGMTLEDVVSLFGSPDEVDAISYFGSPEKEDIVSSSETPDMRSVPSSYGSPGKGWVISPFGSSGTKQQTKPKEDESGEKKADLQPKQFAYLYDMGEVGKWKVNKANCFIFDTRTEYSMPTLECWAIQLAYP
jgi:hypothetical protein